MSPEPPTRLLLVRHGEAQVAVDRVVGGERTCTGLSELGRAQAERLAERWRSGFEPAVDVLCASTMPRARETADVLAPVLDLEPVLDAELVELRPGEADGVSWDEVAARFGTRDLDSDPFAPFSPGGESRAVFTHRVLTALAALARHHAGSSILVACHGGVIDVAMRHVLGLGLTARLDLWTRNCSVTEMVHAAREGEPRRWRLVRYNDCAHLAGLPASTQR